MATSDPLVSVVTPVYNGGRFLRNCIKSVLAQTYSNWDYTIVNNCSTDQTLEIAQEFAAKHPRIRIVTNPAFVGAIENHNNAFRHISPDSKFCKVVAADDQLMPECLERMVRVAEEHPRVGVVGAYGLKESQVIYQGVSYPEVTVPGFEAARNSLLGRYHVFGSPTAVLFRSDIVRRQHRFYDESNLHADGEACLRLMEHYDFGFVHQVLTVHGVQEDSLSAASVRFHAYLPSKLETLMVHGPRFLSTHEMKVRLKQHMHEYYWYLGKEVFKWRTKEFWAFHRAQLKRVGFPIRRWRVAWYSARFGLVALLTPRKSAGDVLRVWGQSRVTARARDRIGMPTL